MLHFFQESPTEYPVPIAFSNNPDAFLRVALPTLDFFLQFSITVIVSVPVQIVIGTCGGCLSSSNLSKDSVLSVMPSTVVISMKRLVNHRLRGYIGDFLEFFICTTN